MFKTPQNTKCCNTFLYMFLPVSRVWWRSWCGLWFTWRGMRRRDRLHLNQVTLSRWQGPPGDMQHTDRGLHKEHRTRSGRPLYAHKWQLVHWNVQKCTLLLPAFISHLFPGTTDLCSRPGSYCTFCIHPSRSRHINECRRLPRSAQLVLSASVCCPLPVRPTVRLNPIPAGVLLVSGYAMSVCLQ